MNYNIINTTHVEPPEKRIGTLLLLNPKIELNINMAVIKYYHFGRQLINMAKVNAKENDLEKAYVYYTRFMTLFLETIKEHPDYKNVPIEERNLNYRALRKAFLNTENIKTKLLKQFRTQYKLRQEQNKDLQELWVSCIDHLIPPSFVNT
ncbi:STAM-binding protein-like isoform X2 [Aphis gossypii]|uniref:STAM-binding protein-like isoform X2 n=1 Tax=Aphis gossypii TaxID=80765 RepID=UPI0021591354|nr:STAM-binding protein-like isoform X2 [Aphis gossypii]